MDDTRTVDEGRTHYYDDGCDPPHQEPISAIDEDLDEPSDDPRLIRLRMELMTAPQTLQGHDLEEFWKIIDDLQALREVFSRR